MLRASPACPLCFSYSAALLYEESGREFFACSTCSLAFLARFNRLPPDQEKSRYVQHNNDINDPRYRGFVRPLYEEVRKHVRTGASGLDFGSGTGPVLAEMLRNAGHKVSLFDPFFHKAYKILGRTYDFILTCEVVEHLFDPAAVFLRLRRMLRDGGVLGIMTLLWEEGIDFASWHYRRDPTHVVFYSQATFRWIQRHYRFSGLWFPADRIVLLRA
jgi:SAM-dependent methyltransferase